jgi:hypothetical protein
MRRGAALLLLCAACDEPAAPLPSTFPGLVAVSGSASWNSSCQGPAGGGTVFPNAGVEPSIAIDPTNPQHLIGVWQQDRWSNGGANGIVSAATFDGGQTWMRNSAKFSRCTGGAYDRATDPWVSIGPGGTAWQIAYVFDANAPNRAMLVSRSSDGGRTWQDPQQLQHDTAPDPVMDKETVTADPLDPLFVYAVWDRLTGTTVPNNPLGTGPAWFARTTDGGESWETARQIYDPGPDTQTVSNQIVVLPDGTLVDLLVVITQNSTPTPRATVSVLRSTDRGVSWPPPAIPVADAEFVGVNDPKNGRGIRTGSVVPTIAVDRANGALYIAWEDARFSGMARDGIALSKSTDGGLHWSAPVQVNGAPAVPAFTPALAVASNGSVGVTYYDLRRDNASDSDHLMVAQWLATSTDGGATFADAMIGGPFDLRSAPLEHGAYFLGDYQGLVSAGRVFLPFFVAVPGSGPSSVFFGPAGVATVGRALQVARSEAQQLWRGARERWRFSTLFK